MKNKLSDEELRALFADERTQRVLNQEFGRRGGMKSAANLSARARSERARKAGLARAAKARKAGRP